MTNYEKIYKIMSEVTGTEIKYLQWGEDVELIRPSEVVEIVEKMMEE